MINKLSLRKYNELRQLVIPLDHHLTLHSIIAGMTPAEVYVDQEKKPKAAVVWVREKVWLLGLPFDPFVDELLETLEENYFPSLNELNEEYFRFITMKNGDQCWI